MNTRGTSSALHVGMLFVIILVLALALGGGGWGYSRFGYASWSPLGLIVVLLLIVWATGNLRLV